MRNKIIYEAIPLVNPLKHTFEATCFKQSIFYASKQQLNTGNKKKHYTLSNSLEAIKLFESSVQTFQIGNVFSVLTDLTHQISVYYYKIKRKSSENFYPSHGGGSKYRV